MKVFTSAMIALVIVPVLMVVAGFVWLGAVMLIEYAGHGLFTILYLLMVWAMATWVVYDVRRKVHDLE